MTSRTRLVLFAVLLPAAVAASNQALLIWASGPWLRLLLFPWMALSTAVLGWCVGKYLTPAWIRWFVFGWCLVLLDCLTIAACIGGRIERHFGYVLVLAQISLVVLWAILATASWQWRLPVVLATAAGVLVFSGSVDSNWGRANWNLVMLIATSVMLIVCGAIRYAGFALIQTNSSDWPSNEHQMIQANQFGLKHLLIWATAVVPILVVSRGADFFILKRLGGPDVFSLVLFASVLATVNLTAIWAVLGHRFSFLPLAALLIVPYFLAQGMSRYLEYIESNYVTIRGLGPWSTVSFSNAWYDSLLSGIAEERDSLVRFLCLDAALLAALLLFLRASGYRLMKKQR